MIAARAGTFRWTDREVREALGLPDGGEQGYAGVSTDTRTIRPGELFVALEGPNFDGHAFLAEARRRGAPGAVVRRGGPGVPEPGSEGVALYRVEDTLAALGALARHRRRRLDARVVGITGSSGKTTAKELLSSVLAAAHRVHATRGTLNNQVGVPLTLLSAPVDADVVVVEMGTNEPGEIALLSAVAEPDLGVLTTVGASHLEGLGTLEGVLAEKLSLLEALPAGAGAVVGDLPPELPARARALPLALRVAGLSGDADREWRGELLDMDSQGRWRVRIPAGTFRPGIPGRQGVRNALLALAAGDLLGVAPEAGFPHLEAVRAPKLRGEIRRLGALTLLLDCYNANPQSTRAALELLADLPAPGGRVAVLGSMLELGPEGPAFHREILREALGLPLRLLVAVGAFGEVVGDLPPGERGGPDGPEVVAAATPEEAWALLEDRLVGTEAVLLKASRGVALEGIVPRFEAAFGPSAEAS